MTEAGVTRRVFAKALGATAAGVALPALLTRSRLPADAFRDEFQIGAMGALRTTLPAAGSKYDLAFDAKDFRDSTSVLLAIEQGELDIGNTTTQHLIRAISENIPSDGCADGAAVTTSLFVARGSISNRTMRLAEIACGIAQAIGKACHHRRADRIASASKTVDLSEVHRNRSGQGRSDRQYPVSKPSRARWRPPKSIWR